MQTKISGWGDLEALKPGGSFRCRFDEDWTLLEASDSLVRFLGYTQEEFRACCGDKMSAVIYPDDLAVLRPRIVMQLQQGTTIVNENRLICKDGTIKWIWLSAELLKDTDGSPFFYCIFVDVSAHKASEERLAQSNQRYDFVLAQTRDIIYEWDYQAKTIYHSPNFYRLFGYAPPVRDFPESILAADYVHPDDREAFLAVYQCYARGARESEGEFRLRTADGVYLWMRSRASAVFDTDGRLLKVLGMLNNIDDYKRELTLTSEQAQRDPLTGLYNRAAAASLISKLLAGDMARGALLLADIDDFKGINDTQGHMRGDEALIEVARGMQSLFRGGDIIARVGGDEFIIFLPDIAADCDIADRAQALVELFRHALACCGIAQRRTGSVGVALYPQHGATFSELYQSADAAMYAAKNSGKNRYAVYDPSLPQSAGVMTTGGRVDLAMRTLRIFQDISDPEQAMPLFLAQAANALGCTRAYMIERMAAGWRQRFGWCAADAAPPPDDAAAQGFPPGPALFDGEPLYVCGDTARLAAGAARDWLRARGADAALLCAIFDSGALRGLIICECSDGPRAFGQEAAEQVYAAAQIAGLFLLRRLCAQPCDIAPASYEELLRRAGVSLYAVDPETYRLVFVSRGLRGSLEGLTEGALCYKSICGLEAPCGDCPLARLAAGETPLTMEKYLPARQRRLALAAMLIPWRDARRLALFSAYDITPFCGVAARYENIGRDIPCGMFFSYLEKGFPCRFINQRLLAALGYADEAAFRAATGGRMVNCIHPDDREAAARSCAEQLAAGDEYELLCRLQRRAGSVLWAFIKGRRVAAEDGRAVVVSVCFDVSAQTALQERAARDEERYQAALQLMNICIWEHDIPTGRSSHIKWFGETVYSGRELADVPESVIAAGQVRPESVEDYRALYRKLRDGAKAASADICFQDATMARGCRWMRVRYTALPEHGRAVALAEDITRQKELELRYQQELRTRQESLRDVVAYSIANLTRDVVEYIRAAGFTGEQGGMRYAEMLAIGMAAIVNTGDRARYQAALSREALLEAYAAGRHEVAVEYRHRDTAGRLRWAEGYVRLAPEEKSGDIIAYGVIRDIHARKQLELRLRQRVERDPATGVYNRETALGMIRDAARHDEYALLLFRVEGLETALLDSDPQTAEQMLRQLCGLLRDAFGTNKIIGRMGGDEFIVFVSGTLPRQRVSADAEEICRAFRSLYDGAASGPRAGLSAGAAFGGPELPLQEVAARARAALDLARAEGGRRCVAYADPREQPVLATLPAYEMVFDCAQAIVSAARQRQALDAVLRRLGTYYQARAVRLLETDETDRLTDGYSWHAGAQQEALPAVEYLRFLPELCANGVVSAPDLESLPPCFSEARAALRERGVSGVCAMALCAGERRAGYLVMENPGQNGDDTTAMAAVGRLLAGDLLRRRLQTEQAYLSRYDAMTGLLNRNSYLEYSHSVSEEALISLGVISFDINGLKRLNLEHGYDYGDSVIRFVARQARERLAGFGQVYRFAGDEFLAVCENITRDIFIKEIHALHAEVERVYPGCLAIGYAWSDNEIDLAALAGLADERMILSKQGYYETLRTATKAHDPATLQSLRQLLADGCFRIYLQPKAETASGRIVGAEALCRLQHPQHGFVLPGKFIPALERRGYIRYVDMYIFEQVCKQLRAWLDAGLRPLPVSLNFSRSTLLADDLLQMMFEITERYRTPRYLLEVEITESIGQVGRETLVNIGRQVMTAGYRLALDDFGAQYSNLSVLSVLQPDVIKLDKSLIRDIAGNEATRVIIRNFIQTCRALEIGIVAEGVETKEQFDLLRELGCEQAQGYYFNKPIPVADFEKRYLTKAEKI